MIPKIEPRTRFGATVTARGFALYFPPAPYEAFGSWEAMTLAGSIVLIHELCGYAAESRLLNMWIVPNPFSIHPYPDAHDANGNPSVIMRQPPPPGAPITRDDSMRMAFWLVQCAKVHQRSFTDILPLILKGQVK